MRKLKIGILGATRGVDFLKRVLVNHPYAEVSAICEKHLLLKQKIEDEVKTLSTKVHVFSDYDEFINSDLDAVILANFANEHAPYAVKALNKGLHVLSENLPTQTMKEAVELCEAVEKSGKIYAYGENYCYLPQVLEIRKMFENGDMGEIMHMEGNFFNDCSLKWHMLTRGDRNHWRNFVPSTFYCTHSIGPMMFATGRRAVSVVGMETPLMPYLKNVGARSGSAAMEIMQLDNGGMAKSCNGNYRRKVNREYRFIAENGTVETDIYSDGKINIFTVNQAARTYESSTLVPPYIFDDIEIYGNLEADRRDLYLINVFIQTILGNEVARKYLIDVYSALDMSVPGLLAYRSILNGSNSVKVPDFRNHEERILWKDDNCSTDSNVSHGADLLPTNRNGFIEIDDEVYQRVADEFAAEKITTGSH